MSGNSDKAESVCVCGCAGMMGHKEGLQGSRQTGRRDGRTDGQRGGEKDRWRRRRHREILRSRTEMVVNTHCW